MHGDAAWARYARVSWVLYVTAVVFAGFAGAGLTRGLLALSLLSLVVAAARGWRGPFMNATAWWALAWLLIAVVSTLVSPFRARGLDALHKLLPWLQIPLALALVRTMPRLRLVTLAWVAGVGVLAVITLAEAAATWREASALGLPLVSEGSLTRLLHHQALEGQDALTAIIADGDMQSGQRLAAGFVATLALLLFRGGVRAGRERLAVYLILPVILTALFVTFKRGAFLMGLAVAVALVLLRLVQHIRGPRRVLAQGLGWLPVAAMTALLLGCLVLVPRVDALSSRTEAASRQGGRTCMWTRITPALFTQHPWLGRGFKTLESSDMRAIYHRVEPRQSHVHANILQVVIDTGLLGVAAFLGWMVTASRRAWRSVSEDAMAPSIAIAGTLLVLMLCGLVEYQLGSAQVVLVYGMTMGCLGVAAPEPRGAG